MYKFIFSLAFLFLFQFQLYTQNCDSERYQKAVFTNVTKTTDLVYATADTYDAFNLPIEFDFELDVYEPAGDVLEKRPLVIMQFGGAYIFGNKEHEDMKAWCDSLARYGYVAVSLDYRLGVNALSAGSATRAMYRGVQDTRAAIRYMIEHQDIYRIDPDHIYLGGESAGAINSMHTAFMTTEAERPQETYGITLENFDLGCLDCSGNSYQHSFDIKGVIDLWGGVLDLNYISANEEIPTLMIHGDNDFIVPYDEGYPFLNDFQLTFPYLYTSESIHDHMDAEGIYNEFYLYPGEGHLFYGLPEGVITFPNENWIPVWTQGHEFLYKTLEFDSPSIIGDNQVMVGADYVYSVPFTDGSEYCWNVVGGTIMNNDNNEVTIQWNSGVGEISVTEINCIGVVGNESELMLVTATVTNNEMFEMLGVHIYPNFIRQGEDIFIMNNSLIDFPISIFDSNGQLIKKFEINAGGNLLETNDLSSGMYIISLTYGSGNYDQRIVIQ